MFMALCKYQRLNPFLREAYLVKYGQQNATIITGKEAFLKRAMQVTDLRGFKAGVVVQGGEKTYDTDGIVPRETMLVGGWAEVHREGWAFPLRVEVNFDEYVGRKGDGSINSMWASKPATMIRKVALVQALREAFPVDLAGMYSPEEINSVPGDLPHSPVDTTIDVPTQQQEQKATRGRPKKESVPEVPNTTPEPQVESQPLDKGVVTESVQVTCPKSGDAILSSFCLGTCPDKAGCPEWS